MNKNSEKIEILACCPHIPRTNDLCARLEVFVNSPDPGIIQMYNREIKTTKEPPTMVEEGKNLGCRESFTTKTTISKERLNQLATLR